MNPFPSSISQQKNERGEGGGGVLHIFLAAKSVSNPVAKVSIKDIFLFKKLFRIFQCKDYHQYLNSLKAGSPYLPKHYHRQEILNIKVAIFPIEPRVSFRTYLNLCGASLKRVTIKT